MKGLLLELEKLKKQLEEAEQVLGRRAREVLAKLESQNEQ